MWESVLEACPENRVTSAEEECGASLRRIPGDAIEEVVITSIDVGLTSTVNRALEEQTPGADDDVLARSTVWELVEMIWADIWMQGRPHSRSGTPFSSSHATPACFLALSHGDTSVSRGNLFRYEILL